MKKVLKFFSNWLIVNITISLLVTLITWLCGVKDFFAIGLVTFAGLGVLVILYVWIREMYWWFNSKEDYKK